VVATTRATTGPTPIPFPVAIPSATASSTPATISAPTPPSRRLSEETAALDAARKALAEKDASGALQALDLYDRAFPSGFLAPEATVLRIEALAQRGDDEAALAAARAFLASHPASPHARRVRSIAEAILAKPPR
jgi:TolA-binding protein